MSRLSNLYTQSLKKLRSSPVRKLTMCQNSTQQLYSFLRVFLLPYKDTLPDFDRVPHSSLIFNISGELTELGSTLTKLWSKSCIPDTSTKVNTCVGLSR